jgi:hypothetical protein
MGLIEKYDNPIRLFSATIYLYLAYQYFSLWVFPKVEDVETILTYSYLMAFEIIMLHSAVFMFSISNAISSRNKLKAIAFFVLFYGIFALAFNYAMPNNTLFYTYLLAVFNRSRFVIYENNALTRKQVFNFSVSAAVMYIIVVFTMLALLLNEYLPFFGLTPDFLKQNGYYQPPGEGDRGLFIDNPHFALSFGTVYFVLLFVLECIFLYLKPKNQKVIVQNIDI